jgi:hypothetical protein
MRSTQIKALTHTTLGLPIDLHTQQISCSNRTCSIQRSEALRAIRESKPKRINSNAIHAYPSSHPPKLGTPVRPVHPADLLLQRKLLNPELRSSAHVKMHQTIGSNAINAIKTPFTLTRKRGRHLHSQLQCCCTKPAQSRADKLRASTERALSYEMMYLVS